MHGTHVYVRRAILLVEIQGSNRYFVGPVICFSQIPRLCRIRFYSSEGLDDLISTDYRSSPSVKSFTSFTITLINRSLVYFCTLCERSILFDHHFTLGIIPSAIYFSFLVFISKKRVVAFLSVFPRYEVVAFIALVRASYLRIQSLISVYDSEIRTRISPIFYCQIREIEIVDRTRSERKTFRYRILFEFQTLKVTRYSFYSVPSKVSFESATHTLCRAIQIIYLFFNIRQCIRIIRIGTNIFTTLSFILLKTGDQKIRTIFLHSVLPLCLDIGI